METGKSRMKVLADLVLRPLCLAFKQLPSHCVLTWLLCVHVCRKEGKKGEGEKRKLSGVTSENVPTLVTSSDLNYLPKVLSPKSITLKVTALMYDWQEGRGQNTQSLTFHTLPPEIHVLLRCKMHTHSIPTPEVLIHCSIDSKVQSHIYIKCR